MSQGSVVGDSDVARKIRSMRAAGATYAQIRAELRVGATTISRALGVYGLGRSRPRVSDDVRSRAIALRRDGHSVPEIAAELGIARSTAWLVTKEVAWEPTPERQERAKRAARARWDRYNQRQAVERKRVVDGMVAEIGNISERELLLVGAALYWAEGEKAKPWRQTEQLGFINSDPEVILLHLKWLRLLGVRTERLVFRVHIHESADVAEAEKYWSDVVGVPVERFSRATLKKHNPRTVRRNTGESYRGCLVVRVRRSAGEYRAMAGIWRGICATLSGGTVNSGRGSS
ncbi:helix-turn-helix domain-containing protein [Phytoactinopolyspora limicola]|uniref:helix-turn-helix domain-containing protein n=1 Tax=Phytoactinopolyspora limicola TaxID=2715536 RepID=UPI00140BD239|nr:helix-turn-helix domain-containing protein [Phytoactinopolyspora limicola]